MRKGSITDSMVGDRAVSQVIKLSTGVCSNNADLAMGLRKLADEIEKGDWGNIEFLCTVMDSDEGVVRNTLGRAGTNKRDTVGLLTWAIHKLISNE